MHPHATVNSPFPLERHFGGRLVCTAPLKAVGGGFSGATVLKAECRGGTFAVRGWPAGTNAARLRGLHRLLRHVAAQGLPVAVPLVDERGETLVEANGRLWQVEPWLAGTADFRAHPTASRRQEAMRLLAAFHKAASTFVATRDEADWFGGPKSGPAPAVVDRLTILGRLRESEAAQIRRALAADRGAFAELSRTSLDCFDEIAARVESELRLVATASVPLVPCLRDVWHDHLLWARDALTGLIDPSACRCDTVATDLSRLLGSLLGDDVAGWDAAIAEYAQHRPLTLEEAALVPILDRSGLLLSTMTWLRRRYVEGRDCDTPAVVERLRAFVERLEGIG